MVGKMHGCGFVCFFFSSRRRHTRYIGDWSSDVCSSDLSNWKVATQLYPTSDPFTFTAPNLQYWTDSPTEFSDFVMSTFSVPNANGHPANFRLAVHPSEG